MLLVTSGALFWMVALVPENIAILGLAVSAAERDETSNAANTAGARRERLQINDLDAGAELAALPWKMVQFAFDACIFLTLDSHGAVSMHSDPQLRVRKQCLGQYRDIVNNLIEHYTRGQSKQTASSGTISESAVAGSCMHQHV